MGRKANAQQGTEGEASLHRTPRFCQLRSQGPKKKKKPGTSDCQTMQALRETNKWVKDIHVIIPNPYNLLSSPSLELQVYSVLDLKDAFFSLTLKAKSQLLFAFEWHSQDWGFSGQHTRTLLPQGVKNFSTVFDEALQET